MEKSYIISKIQELVPWYQTIDLDGIITTSKKTSGENVWIKINKLVPEGFKNKRILDLGCNAGFYCMKAALDNCKEVIGVELDPGYFKQTSFIKEYFEDKYNSKFNNVSFINSNISDLDFESLGKFDYVFALAIIYHIGKHRFGKYTEETMQEQKRIIRILSTKTDRIIVRCRNSKLNDMSHYDELFKSVGFDKLKFIDESKRTLILYGC